jgi:multidrug efflux pump subunit AcrA (membrane-fusion protein)
MTRKKALIFVVVLLVGAAVVAANLWFQREPSVSVTSEAIRARDLEAVVSASGRFEPQAAGEHLRQQMGRVTRLAVAEGQQVKAGQFLLEIDPRSLEGQLQRGEASVAAARVGAAAGADGGRSGPRQPRVWRART